jgi:flagellar basal body-associated protein FliL
MPNASQAEIYFIAAMFALIIVISAVATYFFFRTYKRKRPSGKAESKNKTKTEN